MRIKKALLPPACLAIFIALGYWIMQSEPEASQGSRIQASPLLVESRRIVPQDFKVSIRSFGTVQAKRRGEVHSLVSGQIQYLSPEFKAGGSVVKGQVLLRLDTSEYELAVQEARSNLANAELALAEETTRSEQAARDWSKQKPIETASDYTLRKPQLKAARANLKTAKARLDLAELNLERCAVKASFTGRIQQTLVEAGSVVSPSMALATGYETEAAEVRLAVDTKSLKYLNLPPVGIDAINQSAEEGGEVATVRFTNSLAEPPEFWTGRLVRSEAAVDVSSQQFYMVAEIQNPFGSPAPLSKDRQSLKLGQFLEAEIEGRWLKDVVVIPSASIYQGRYVYLASEGRLARQAIEVLWRDERDTVLRSGLSEGDILVLTPLGQVSSGTPVELKSSASAADTLPVSSADTMTGESN